MTHLKEGDIAPNFNGVNELGETVQLSDFKGRKLVLFFYPKDNTPGCTMEACSLRDNFDVLREQGFEMLGVSADTKRKHQNFINKFSFQFHLLADTEKEVSNAYGVWGAKKMFGIAFEGISRTTFVIDEEGKIAKIFKKVKTRNHAQQILDAFA